MHHAAAPIDEPPRERRLPGKVRVDIGCKQIPVRVAVERSVGAMIQLERRLEAGFLQNRVMKRLCPAAFAGARRSRVTSTASAVP